MNTPIITVKNISKKYNINHSRGGYIALRDVLTNIFKNPFAFIKDKTKNVLGIDTKEEFWALKDINFEVMKGEVIGIIGRNGAGKSTLLKILSQITPPTTGEIKIKGKVGSLLEVGTGFHPELSGRENIFLNGAILGMTKKEIVNKFDQIVEFAGIEKFIDTPVKHYSSGMYVRLAFSVAAHMEPDILIVDEVLAVGDAEFQKKCLGKMEDITKNEGRTILFVSHNMDAIQELCTKSILLVRGQLKAFGSTKEILEIYSRNETIRDDVSSNQNNNDILKNISHQHGTKFTNIEILNQKNNILKSHDPIKVLIKYSSEKNEILKNPRIVLTITNEVSKNIVLRLDSDIPNDSLSYEMTSSGEILCETDSINLTEGRYVMDADFLIDGTSVNHLAGIRKFEVETDLKEYNYKNYPDKNVCDNVIRYSFKQSNEK